MRKLYLFGLALLGVIAFGAVAVGSASAVVPVWLFNGARVTNGVELPVKLLGASKLLHLAGGFLEPEAVIECEGTFDGVVYNTAGVAGEGLITALLTEVTAEEVTAAKPLACKSVTTCEAGDATIYPEHLPWLVVLELMEPKPGEELLLALLTEDREVAKEELPAYVINCLILGGLHEALCEGETSGFFELMAGNVLLLVTTKAELEAEGLEGLCEGLSPVTEDQPKVTVQEGSGELSDTEAGELDVSEE